MLHYASRQIFWDCATESACEAFPNGIPRQLDTIATIDRNWRELLQTKQLGNKESSGDPANSSSLFWKNAVRSYTACKLTKHEDKLKAIWGIAKLVRDVEEDDYGSGLWASQLHEQLAWTVADNSQAKKNTEPAPSWSWASVQDGTIHVTNRYPDYDRFYCVKDPDGGPVTFQLDKRLYASRNDGSDDRAVQPFTKSDYDEEPKLEARAISMQCLMSSKTATLKRAYQGRGWSLVFPGQNQESSGLEVFLDTLPAGNTKDCEFIVLAVSKREAGRYEDGRPIYGEAKHVHEEEYSGTGLLVDNAGSGGGVYRRIGAFKFQHLSRVAWMQIRRACGQDGGSDTRFDEGKYSKIRLE
jgi:hypothetical protein